MPTLPGGYRTADGKRVPSVTTICSRFKESGGLIYWANRIALEPALQARALLLEEQRQADLILRAANRNELEAWSTQRKARADFLMLDPDTWDHKKASEKAADAGTIAHEMVDCWIKKQPFQANGYAPALVEMAQPAYDAFLQWAEQSKLEITETEKPLVSEKYRFGGTRDAIFIQGKRAVGDYKTSNAIYPEHLLQLAAYGILDEEAGNTIDGGYHLVRFSKLEKPTDPVQFLHHYWSHLEEEKIAFIKMRELYDLMASIAKRAK